MPNLTLKRSNPKVEPNVTKWTAPASKRVVLITEGKPGKKVHYDALQRADVFYSEDGVLAVCLDNPHYNHSTKEWSTKVALLDRLTILREFEKGVRE